MNEHIHLPDAYDSDTRCGWGCGAGIIISWRREGDDDDYYVHGEEEEVEQSDDDAYACGRC